jgi:predicted O-methyltransferase YrrM
LIENATREMNFTMASDAQTGSLLRTLAATKPRGRFLELGTGTGLSTSWILNGMDTFSTLVTVDNDRAVLNIARKFLGADQRLTVVESDGGEWIKQNENLKFHFIFADTWHGKYLMLENVLNMLHVGGLYIVDDMLPQPNWPEGHHEKALTLAKTLEQMPDLFVTHLHWSTGILVCVKKE